MTWNSTIMAKFPLLDQLRQAYKIARIVNQSGIPADEVIDMLQEKISRRRLLYGGMALGGAIAGAELGDAPRPAVAASADAKILVIGAGIAGLTAAYRLQQAGVAVDIIEARDRVGGRMYSSPNALGTSTTVELGGEFIDTDHLYIQQLAKELGFSLANLDDVQAGLIPTTYYFQGRNVPLSEIVGYYMPVAPIIAADAIAADQSTKALIRFDQLSIYEYLTTYLSQKGVTINPILLELLDVAYTTEYGREISEQSSLNLIFLIGTDATTTGFSIFGVSDEKFQIIGGNQQLPLKLANILETSILTGTVLEAICQRSDGRYQVSSRSGSKSFDRTYERVLLTLPFSVLRTVQLEVDLPPLKRLAINQLGYGTNAKLITAYQERIWRTQYHATASIFTDLGFQNTWEASSYATGVNGLISDFTGGKRGLSLGIGTPEDQAQRLLPQLETVFPGITAQRQGNAIRAFWPGQPYSRGSYACYLVGQWTQFYVKGVEGQRVNNLFFAGEHTSQNFQGYMEGGCETGTKAAVEILKDLGVKK
jgi:monoamine oxidase